MKPERFILETENEIINCETLFKFYNEEYQKHYIVYTDGSIDENGETNVFISSYNPEDPKLELQDITNEQELEIISNMVDKIWSELDDWNKNTKQ